MASLRVAIVGLGFMGSKHLQAFQKSQQAAVVAVYSRDPQKLRGDLSGVQGNLGGPGGVYDFGNLKKYTELASLLGDSEIDAVDVCLPTNLHADFTIEALRSGKDVLVEKPMALDADSAGRMAAVAEETSRILMVAHVLRFFPEYQALLQRVDSGSSGKVLAASFRRRCAAPAWSGWLSDVSQSGGGAFDLLIHDVDICLKLFGRPEFVAAHGYQDLRAGIDVISARLSYARDLQIEIAGGWHHPANFPFSMEYTVVMEDGTLDFRHETRPPTLYKKSGGAEPLSLSTQDGYQAEIDYFVQCCRQRDFPSLCAPRESAEAVKLFQQLLQSREHRGERFRYA